MLHKVFFSTVALSSPPTEHFADALNIFYVRLGILEYSTEFTTDAHALLPGL